MKKFFVNLASAGILAAALVAMGCANPTIPSSQMSTTTTTTNTGTTIGTITFTGTGITETAPVLHLTAEFGSFTVTCSDGTASSKSLSGTAWWAGTNGDTATTIADGATVTYTVVTPVSSTDFLVEVHNTASSLFLSTTSQLTAWGAGTVAGQNASAVEYTTAGHTYKVVVTRSGDTYTFKYVDMGN